VPLLRDLSHKSLNSGNATGPHYAIHHPLVVLPSNGIHSDMLTASLINQLYVTDTQPITGLPIHRTSIYGFSFSRVNRTHATNIRVRNSHHSLNSIGCGHFANSAINCLMSTSGHSFRVKQETKQLKLLPNVITIYCST
jgi:hypothetical protein